MYWLYCTWGTCYLAIYVYTKFGTINTQINKIKIEVLFHTWDIELKEMVILIFCAINIYPSIGYGGKWLYIQNSIHFPYKKLAYLTEFATNTSIYDLLGYLQCTLLYHNPSTHASVFSSLLSNLCQNLRGTLFPFSMYEFLTYYLKMAYQILAQHVSLMTS